MSDDWLSLLRARVAEIGVAPTARTWRQPRFRQYADP